MADLPPYTVAEKWRSFALAFCIGVFLLVAMATLSWAWQEYFVDREQDLKMALVDARVTAVSETNRRFSYQLDGNELEEYNFRSFVAANPAARTGYDEDVGWDSSDLSHYLRQGDRLSKAANSPRLTVRRGTVITHWLLDASTSESKRPPPAKPPAMESPDSIGVH